MKSAPVAIMIIRPWRTQRKPMLRAVRQLGRSGEISVMDGSRGKNMRKRRRLVVC